MLTAAAIVPAAGRGVRLGPGAPKALRELAGVPMLVHAVRALLQAPSIGQVVVAAPAAEVAQVTSLLGTWLSTEVVVVAGGETRQTSVRSALDRLDRLAAAEVVLVHDAARPLAPTTLAEQVVAAVLAGADAVVPAVPIVDTVKRVDADGGVIETLDRSRLRAVQTPQGFRRGVLVQAHALAPDSDSTDDAGLVERLGGRVRVIAGSDDAFKVTRPVDLALAEAVLTRRRASHVG